MSTRRTDARSAQAEAPRNEDISPRGAQNPEIPVSPRTCFEVRRCTRQPRTGDAYDHTSVLTWGGADGPDGGSHTMDDSANDCVANEDCHDDDDDDDDDYHDDMLHRMFRHESDLIINGVLPWTVRDRKADLLALAACSRRLLGIVCWFWRCTSREDDKARAAQNEALPDDMAIAAGLPSRPKPEDAVAEFRILAITAVALPLIADAAERIEWLSLACREEEQEEMTDNRADAGPRRIAINRALWTLQAAWFQRRRHLCCALGSVMVGGVLCDSRWVVLWCLDVIKRLEQARLDLSRLKRNVEGSAAKLKDVVGLARNRGLDPLRLFAGPLVPPSLRAVAWMGVDLGSSSDSDSAIAKRTFDPGSRLWMPWAQVAHAAGRTRSLRLLDVAERCARRGSATARSSESSWSPMPWVIDTRSLCPLLVVRGVSDHPIDHGARDASHHFFDRLRAMVIGAATRLAERYPDGEEACRSFCEQAIKCIVAAKVHLTKEHPDVPALLRLAMNVAAWPSVMRKRRGAPCDARGAFSVMPEALTITILYRTESSQAIRAMGSASRPFCAMVRDPEFWHGAYAALPGVVTDARPHIWGKDWRWLHRAFTTYPRSFGAKAIGHVYYDLLGTGYHGALCGEIPNGYGVMVTSAPPRSRLLVIDADSAPRVLDFAWNDGAGCRFDGLWSYGQFVDGLCSFTYASGVRFEGLFRHRSVAGGQESYSKGLMMYGNGGRYEGECLAGKRHGHGVYTFVDGTQHEGGCPRDRLGGAGKEMLHRKNDLEADGTRYDGTWEADRFVGAAAAFP